MVTLYEKFLNNSYQKSQERMAAEFIEENAFCNDCGRPVSKKQIKRLPVYLKGRVSHYTILDRECYDLRISEDFIY